MEIGKNESDVLSPPIWGSRGLSSCSRDDDALAPWLDFDLQINLKRICSVDHLPGCAASRPEAFQRGLDQAVEYQFNRTACRLMVQGQFQSSKRWP